MAAVVQTSGFAQQVLLHPDARNGQMLHWTQTLGTTGQVTSITLPAEAVGFRLSQASASVYFAINEDPVAPAAVAYAASVTASSSGTVGNTVTAAAVEVRLPESRQVLGTNTRTLRLLPASNGATVFVEIW
jgi:hypothetical protein